MRSEKSNKRSLAHFFDTPSLKNTIIASIIGFSFDLIPLIFAFVAFHGYVPEEEDYDPVIG